MVSVANFYTFGTLEPPVFKDSSPFCHKSLEDISMWTFSLFPSFY